MERKSPLQFNTEQFFHDIAGISYFAVRYFKNIFTNRFEFREFIKQCFKTGVQSLLLIAVTALILGLVLTIQIRPIVAKLGAESW
ncbi:ABC transporter permease, partial [Bacteroidota bacterium]